MRDRDHTILTTIHNLILTHGYSPSMAEIAEASGVPSKQMIHAAFGRLREAGLITFLPGCNRTVRLTGDGEFEVDE